MAGTRRTRATAGAVLAGLVVGGSAACTSGGEPAAVSTSDLGTVETTSTTAPPTTSSRPTGVEAKAPDIDAGPLLDAVKRWIGLTANVTVDATLWDEETRLEIHAEGSRGPAGSSRSVVTTDDGATLELLVVNGTRYIKTDEAYLDTIREAQTIEEEKENPLLKQPAGRYYELPAREDDEEEPLDRFRPHQLVQGTFFGEALTSWDVRRGSVLVEQRDDRTVRYLSIPGDSKSRGDLPRALYVAGSGDPVVHEMVYGTSPQTSSLKFTRWNTTSEAFDTPPRAKKLADDQADQLGLTDG